MLPTNIGTYHARVNGIGIGESKNGLARATIGFVLFETSDGESVEDNLSITGYFSLQLRDGAINQKGIDNLREVFPEWDGKDIFWLQDNEAALNGKEVQIVLDSEEYNGKTSIKVKYLNPIGGGSSGAISKASGDLRKKISSSLNTALRATAKPGATKVAPKATTKPAATTKPTAKPATPPVDADSVWAEFTKAWPAGIDGVEDAWHTMLMTVNKPESKLNGDDWLIIKGQIPKFIPADQPPAIAPDDIPF